MKRKRYDIYACIGAVILFVVSFLPFYVLVVSSFKYQMQIYHSPWFFTLPLHFDNYISAFTKLVSPIMNSILITVISIAIAVVSAMLASYSFSRGNFPFQRTLYYCIIALMMVPGFALLVPQFVQFNALGLSNTFLGQALPPAVNSIALGVLLMTSFFKSIPNSLFESAQIDGAKDGTVLLKIVAPLSAPIIASVAIMTGLSTWNNFVWPLVITRGDKVMPVILAVTKLSGSINQGDGLKLAGYVLVSLPIVILFFFATKPFIEGITAGAVKG